MLAKIEQVSTGELVLDKVPKVTLGRKTLISKAKTQPEMEVKKWEAG